MSDPDTTRTDAPGAWADADGPDAATLGRPRGIGALVTNIVTLIRTLLNDVLALGQAELKPAAKHAGVAAGLFGAAAFFALNALTLLFVAGAFAIARLFGARFLVIAAGFAIMGVLLLVIAGILGAAGYFGQVKKIKGPEKTVAAMTRATESVQQAISRGVANARTHELAAKNFSDDPETYGYR